MEGPLSKWTNVVNGWQYRWFVLDIINGELCYYTSKEKMVKGERRGIVKLKGAQVGIDSEDDSKFTITTDHKTFHFQARGTFNRKNWLDALQVARDLHTQSYPLLANPNRFTQSSIENDFDRRIVETEVYLKILVDQQNLIHSLASNITNTDIAVPKSSVEILNKLNRVVTNIEKAIACLQYIRLRFENTGNSLPSAKSSQCLADDSSDTGRNISVTRSVEMGEKKQKKKKTRALTDEKCGKTSSSKSKIKHTKSMNNVLLTVRNAENSGPSYFINRPNSVIDQIRQSGPNSLENSLRKSIDDQEKFSIEGLCSLDSDDEYFDPIDRKSSNSFEVELSSRSNSLRKQDNGIPFDDLYDGAQESDLGNLSSQGSIISHLLSQVRIGMDLTKITLPTFILERRSGLEMYADFLAHADLWVDIGRGQTSYDRFFAALRWYLSAFHAGRKTDIAKKPYNPILGEIFRCHWKVPITSQQKEESDAMKEKTVQREPDHPVRWAPNESVIFLAEQVSHHPPVSAFYAEYRPLNMILQGSLYTKSKFLGLSVGVEMVGDTNIDLLDHDERYTVNFPSAYGRNIFQIPWIELAGKCTLTCAQTGYNATIDFKPKPYFGNQKNQVYVEAFGPNSKKRLFTIEGEWNREMFIKYPDGRSESFFDVTKYPLFPKSVRPRTEQESNESRKLWEDVTYYLGRNDINSATSAKSSLEDKQRKEAKSRKDLQQEWSPKYFNKNTETSWSYKTPFTIP